MRKNIRRVRRRRIAGLVLIVSLTIAGFSAAIRWLSPLDAKSAGDMIYASYTVIPGSVVKLPIERTNTPVISKAQEESASEITEDHETTGTTVLDMMPIEAASEAYHFDEAVPESDAVDDSYFDDAIFIGDSRTEGFALYSGLGNIRAYTARGASVSTVFTDPVINQNGEKLSIMDAIESSEPFSKAYIMLGINELGWAYEELFIEKYEQIIDTLREINPNVTIYVQSILPVTKEKSDNDSIYNNPKIDTFNALLQKMCEEKEVYYVNVSEAVCDESGMLPADASFDGVHLNKESCQKWLEYLKTHVVEGYKL